ncbi:hypothetical protein KUTeg_013891 [Tegillarca granosa]|uniref:Uncharacterized protein n=1 Tax=Tegillarca granosa TaxID=220873 RepID=A0ABQ9EYE3_TEGGR|nr:hypothetical protein KUTeg_013891 [Tegillarca granosa]
MAQPSKRPHRLSSVSDSEPECTPSKKSSNRLDPNKDTLNDVHERVFNQNTLQTYINMDIIEGKRKNDADKEKQKEQKNEMRKNICALRNSGGGVLITRIKGDSEAGYSNKFHKVFDDMFKEYLFEDEKFGDIYQFENKKDGFLIFVQGSSKIVTTETNTMATIHKGTEKITCQDLIYYFPLEECKTHDIQSRWVQSRYKDEYPYEESDTIQFKSFRAVKNFRNLKNNFKDDIKIYVSAFTKAKTGGSIFFGIEEIPIKSNTKPVVEGIGISLTDNEISNLSDFCGEVLTQSMYWLTVDCSSETGFRKLTPNEIQNYYKLDWYSLPGTRERKHVIELAVAPFEGIVFHSKEGPTAWEVDGNGEVCKISLDRWYSFMTKDVLDARDRQLRDDNDYTDFLALGIPMTLTPEPIVDTLKNKCQGRMAEAFTQLQMHPKFIKNRCIAVLDYNFSIILKENMDNPFPECKRCIYYCDAFIVGTETLPLLLSFCKICDNHDKCMSCCDVHNHKITKILTSKMRSHIRGLSGILSYTINLMKDVNNEYNKALQQDRFYHQNVRTPGSRQANEILLAFVKTVASIPSPVKNVIDDYFLRSFITDMRTMLTLDQYQILYNNYQSTRRLLVHGLPGTGKTEIIKEVMRKLSKSGVKHEEILFVTEHTPLCDVVDKMDVCRTLTRYELNEMWKHNKADLMKVKHVFVDDAQFLDSKKQPPSQMNWFQQLSKIMPLQKDGKFWIFYGNHNYRSFGASVENVIPTHLFEKRTLRSIIRNTKSIAKFAEKYASDVDYTNAVQSIPHDADGEDVDEHHRDLSTDESRFKAFQEEMCDCLKRYKKGSIAVLYDKVDDIPSPLKCQISPFRKRVHGLLHKSEISPKHVQVPGHGRIKIVNASENYDEDAVVVDSARRYTSLDRLAVIAIGIDKPEIKIGYSTFTRPLAKLIVVHNSCVNQL